MEQKETSAQEHLANPLFSAWGVLLVALYVIVFGSLGVVTLYAIFIAH